MGVLTRSSLRPPHHEFEQPLCWYYWREVFVRCTVENASCVMVFIISFMTIGSAIQVILRLLPTTTTIWETAVLILLMGGIYEISHWNGLRWHDIHTKFHNDQFRHSSDIKVITSTIWEDAVLVLLMWEVYSTSLRRA
jgi:hypothetical protein